MSACICPACRFYQSQPTPQLAPKSCPSKEEQPGYIKAMELACSVAFAVFGITVAPIPFAAAFALGVAYEITLKLMHTKITSPGASRPGCGQGNGEMLAGRGLLNYEVVAVTALLFFEHLEHHPEFFVPFLAFWVGARTIVHIDAYWHPDTSSAQPHKQCCH